jgi:hypothetical protein
MRSLIYSFIITFLFTGNTFAIELSNPVDRVIFQYAGDIGKYSAGLGNRVNDWYSLSLHYGVVPKTDIQDKIETWAFKNNLHVFDYEYKSFALDFYLGINIYHIPGRKYQTDDITGADNGYYRQSSTRAMVYIGNGIKYEKHMEFYWESGLNDIWIINSTNNDSIDPKDHISLAIGLNYWI